MSGLGIVVAMFAAAPWVMGAWIMCFQRDLRPVDRLWCTGMCFLLCYLPAAIPAVVYLQDVGVIR